MRAGTEATEWAKKRQAAIERAKQLREERKNGLLKTGQMAIGAPSSASSSVTHSLNSAGYPGQNSSREDFMNHGNGSTHYSYMSPGLDSTSAYSHQQNSYQDDVNDEIRAARESLRLLKSKMSSSKTPNSFHPHFESNPSFRHKGSQDNMATVNNNNYRKAFKPNFKNDQDSLDQYIDPKPKLPRAPVSRSVKHTVPARSKPWEKSYSKYTDDQDNDTVQAPFQTQPKRQTSFQNKRNTPHRPAYQSDTYRDQQSKVDERPTPHSTYTSKKAYQPSNGKPKRNIPQKPVYEPSPSYEQPIQPMTGGGYGVASKYPDISELPPEDAPSGPTMPCPHCQRTFAEPAYSKHTRICQKVFMKKAKKFDMAKHRAADGEQLKYIKKAHREKQKEEIRGGTSKGKPPGKMSKWQAQSAQFRAAMQACRGGKPSGGGGGGSGSYGAKAYAEIDDRTECPYCNRKFNDEAAKRHIPFCQQKAKQNMITGKGGKGKPRGGKFGGYKY